MKYSYSCEICKFSFEREFPMGGDEKKRPLKEPCPRCKKKGSVIRDFSSVSLTYDTLDVRTRAKRVGGEAFTEVMKNIHKKVGRHSKIQI